MTKPNINTTIAELEKRVSELGTEVGDLARQRRALLVKITQAQTEDEKDALSSQAADLLQRQATVQIDLADWRGALADVVDRRDAMAGEATARAEANSIEMCRKSFSTSIEKYARVDRLMAELGEALRDAETAQETAWGDTPIAVRQSELRDYALHKSSLEPLRKLTLGFHGILSNTGPLDKTEQPRSQEDQMRRAVGDLLAPAETQEKEPA